ncbi:HNH endonuclease [Spiribacter vilamensis]|uniref:5-methylcytosine-specific restriction endonuclease McrA n=1 Tax=Spiribacter vilamensis TaxID=531306 RepID=A0A4Q8D1Y2_9GAMM|nr:HNH endonuclease [Spiribacter vilamensis]RZU99290.1 5-methylcytosine-specific restriction endonuclease McrA [Spiribacter vilamensis]TVO61726.1 HNH endonuclease [Spiribacter vilamensis]
MTSLQQPILRTDISGMPLEWMTYQDAVRLYHLEQVAYTCGHTLYRIHGGYNARTGLRSLVDVNSIIATTGAMQGNLKDNPAYRPPLNNATLFRRDDHLCLYCGERRPVRELSRDHIKPISRGGIDTWSNVVTACKRCNNLKGNRTPEQAGMQLLAVPFAPTHAEYVYLQGRRILADQMAFLRAHFPRRSPLRERLESMSA